MHLLVKYLLIFASKLKHTRTSQRKLYTLTSTIFTSCSNFFNRLVSRQVFRYLVFGVLTHWTTYDLIHPCNVVIPRHDKKVLKICIVIMWFCWAFLETIIDLYTNWAAKLKKTNLCFKLKIVYFYSVYIIQLILFEKN